MPISVKMEPNNLAVMEVSGVLGFDEFQQHQAEMLMTMQRIGQIRILVKGTDFDGWEKTPKWGNTASTDQVDPYIKKMAIVGAMKWKDLVEVFTLKGLRPVPIEYFDANQEQQARDWLAAD